MWGPKPRYAICPSLKVKIGSKVKETTITEIQNKQVLITEKRFNKKVI